MKNLGPRKAVRIPMEVLDENGVSPTGVGEVLSQWHSDYSKLFSFAPDVGDFDQDFCQDIMSVQEEVEQTWMTLEGLNDDITKAEVKLAIKDAKNNKSVGLQ